MILLYSNTSITDFERGSQMLIFYNIINVSCPAYIRVANTFFWALLAVLDTMVDCAVQISHNTLYSCPVLFGWLWGESGYIANSIVMSGLLLIDNYSKLPMADWYSWWSTNSSSWVAFTGLVLTSTGVPTALQSCIPKLLKRLLVYVDCWLMQMLLDLSSWRTFMPGK